MKRKIFQVDAFTSKPYCGNPAGVVIDAVGLTDEQMMLIAKEMKLSETAFVFPGSTGYDFEVRFFTPTEEVDLCGHATIATFSLLKELGIINKEEVIQKTKAGLLNIKFLGNGMVIMQQAPPLIIAREIMLDELCKIMGIRNTDVGISELMLLPEIWSTGLKDILLPVKSIDVLKGMSPSMDELIDYSRKMDVSGAHVFTIGEENTIWCRNFAPLCGIPEESATGTSNGALGACLYNKGWHEALSFTSHQGYWLGSPSQIFVQVQNGSNPEVWVGGKAVTVLDGEIVIPE
ncbi:PhzF family phenazine biosynthesis protein [Paratissierella segnis]|jgi:trans-2,3-dihydro-3-hydroxyanthranilate isomerase|uniref:PhzF family phenazine biosynthesis protein n=1 Tax=Paratissierella segnis TaxID=2763679 RepID=A0A926EWL9_9FIRM|nr:PhzF family phenazine biosynthesis protein [Paratissierella segnis]MBC8587794.1 PhzF family phenazine biosynthesis protein [Paratissierella segnis]